MEVVRGFCSIITFMVIVGLVPNSLAMDLDIRRDSGTELSGKIKGTFSARVSGIDGVDRVDFYIDGELVETVREEPYRWEFKTTEYPDGNHTLRAVVHYSNGKTDEESARLFFESDFGDWWTWYIWGMGIFVAGMIIFSIWITNRERKKPQGKTKCPACGTVFQRQWNPMHKGDALRNKCPMCGKSFWAERIDEEDAQGSPSVL